MTLEQVRQKLEDQDRRLEAARQAFVAMRGSVPVEFAEEVANAFAAIGEVSTTKTTNIIPVGVRA